MRLPPKASGQTRWQRVSHASVYLSGGMRVAAPQLARTCGTHLDSAEGRAANPDADDLIAFLDDCARVNSPIFRYVASGSFCVINREPTSNFGAGAREPKHHPQPQSMRGRLSASESHRTDRLRRSFSAATSPPLSLRGSSWTITDADVDAVYRVSDAEIARRETACRSTQRRARPARILHENQRVAEIEACKAGDEIHEICGEAMPLHCAGFRRRQARAFRRG